ncbi:MAG TPA: NADH-quinone oxidoreductase subunit C [Acidimicrobiales bacterium]|nr:NADH-quinone oxidoreductase subunit C [Acidimicrobiales bacterium]
MSATEPPTEDEVVEPPAPELRHGAPVTRRQGQPVVHPSRAAYFEVVRALKEVDGFNSCVDVCGADYLAHPPRPLPDGVTPERFEVVVNLLSHTRRERIRVRVQVPADDPVVASLFPLYPGTEAFERETFDLFGVRFEGHPDLTRILMPEDWEGHPLRKDYATGRVPVQFKAAPASR